MRFAFKDILLFFLLSTHILINIGEMLQSPRQKKKILEEFLTFYVQKKKMAGKLAGKLASAVYDSTVRFLCKFQCIM